MNKITKIDKDRSFNDYLKEQLQDPKFKKYYLKYGKQIEIAYQILLLRKKFKMSQLELAKKLGTTQSNVARIESGNQNFSTDLLVRIAEIFGKELRVEFV